MVLILLLWNQVQVPQIKTLFISYTVLVLTCFCLQNFIVSVATNTLVHIDMITLQCCVNLAFDHIPELICWRSFKFSEVAVMKTTI